MFIFFMYLGLAKFTLLKQNFPFIFALEYDAA